MSSIVLGGIVVVFFLWVVNIVSVGLLGLKMGFVVVVGVMLMMVVFVVLGVLVMILLLSMWVMMLMLK